MRGIRVTHVINGLLTGGAEMMLYKLLATSSRDAFASEVVALTRAGAIGQRIQALGIPVRVLGMRRGVPDPSSIARIARCLRQDRPHVVQTWMYHSDLIGGLAARLAGGIPVAWGVRQSTFDPRTTKRSSIWTARACARLSSFLPARIVCCSEAARRVHVALGYAADKMLVIPNGFDVATFRPDLEARVAIRDELRIPEDAAVIGLVARFDPLKDHRNFLQAAGLLHKHRPEVRFVLCGDDVTWDNSRLAGWIAAAGIRRRCHLLGRREDIPRLNAGFDIATLSSESEGFPNVVGEAMACAVPCVVTDVGDAATIVGDTGRVVPSRNPRALAAAWSELLALSAAERSRLGAAARERVAQHFSLPAVVARYEGLYEELAVRGRRTRRSSVER